MYMEIHTQLCLSNRICRGYAQHRFNQNDALDRTLRIVHNESVEAER